MRSSTSQRHCLPFVAVFPALCVLWATLAAGPTQAVDTRLCKGTVFRIGDKSIKSFDALSRFFSYYSRIGFGIEQREMVAMSVEVQKPCSVFSQNLTVYMRASTKDLRVFKDVFQHERLRSVPRSVFNRTRPARILDLGAKTGMATLYFAQKFPGARIAVVEPDINSFALLQLNTAQLPQVQHMFYGAAWDRATTVKFGRDSRGRTLWQRFVVDVVDLTTGRIGDIVPGLNVGDMLDKFGWPDVDLVYADLEGAEAVVIADPSAQQWLTRVKCITVRPLLPDNGAVAQAFDALPSPRFVKKVSKAGLTTWCRADVADTL